MLVEIVADFVCPWCYLGLNRLDRVLAARPHLNLRRRYVPFQLYPDLPPAGIDRRQLEATSTAGRLVRPSEALMVAASRDGIPLRFDRIARVPNTRDAHRMVAFASAFGRADAIVRALFTAHFADGDDLCDPDVLAAAARSAGLDEAAVRDFLATTAGSDLVRADEEMARANGLRAVPVFIFERYYALSGAVEPACLDALLDIVQVDAAVRSAAPT